MIISCHFYRAILVMFWIMSCVNSNEAAPSPQSTHRHKRILEGQPLKVKTPYASAYYFVYISDGHQCDAGFSSGVPYMLGTGCPPSPNNLHCTGALLSDEVVQTACHCVSYFDYRANLGHKTPTLWAHVLSPKEHRFDCFFANHTVGNLTYGFTPKSYYAHPLCRKHSDDHDLLFDYGLIILNKGYYRAQHFAPVYTDKGLTTIYSNLLIKRTVCLFIGFGTYRFKYPKEENTIEDNEKSTILRHGWKTSMDYLSCYWKLYGNGSNHSYNYTKECTWFCTERLPNRPEFYEGTGDSGGPVICDNQYAGLVSQTHSITNNRRGVFGRSMSTAYRLLVMNDIPYVDVLHAQSDPQKTWNLKTSNSQPPTNNFSFAYLTLIALSRIMSLLSPASPLTVRQLL